MDISSLRERRTAPAFTVGELNGYIKSIIENDRTLAAVTVRGEISNFVAHTSGHFYFSLKDETGQIKAIMFRSSAQKIKFMPENGMKVTAHGSVSVYSQGGSYQLYVNSLTPDGVGALYLAYEQLKEKLSGEGLFSEAHKKLIPRFPESVGVITSPTGAAVRDIINVITRRYPMAKIYLYPSLVQGEGAEADLIKALDYFEKANLADVVIIGRGGGSIEDLWAFNGESLARRIYDFKIPIISAVGHETDFTICDFVADMRAPTPSAAAEIAVPDTKDLLIQIDMLSERAAIALKKSAQKNREKLEYIKSSRYFCDPAYLFERRKERVSDLSERLSLRINAAVREQGEHLGHLAKRLDSLSPLSVLSRGFAVAQSDAGVITSVNDVSVDSKIKLILSDGTLNATVTERNKNKPTRTKNKNGN